MTASGVSNSNTQLYRQLFMNFYTIPKVLIDFFFPSSYPEA